MKYGLTTLPLAQPDHQPLTTFQTLHTYILHYITLHTLHYILTCHYITLHYITLHYITLHYITLHYITLHYITLHYITLHYILVWLHSRLAFRDNTRQSVETLTTEKEEAAREKRERENVFPFFTSTDFSSLAVSYPGNRNVKPRDVKSFHVIIGATTIIIIYL